MCCVHVPFLLVEVLHTSWPPLRIPSLRLLSLFLWLPSGDLSRSQVEFYRFPELECGDWICSLIRHRSTYSRVCYPAFLTLIMFHPSVHRIVNIHRVKLCTRARFGAAQCSRRHIQTSSETGSPEAYLEVVNSGIQFLSLNRPKARNAISRRLLQVRTCKYYPFTLSQTQEPGVP